MKVTAKMLGESIHTQEELAVVQATSPKSYAKWLTYLVKAVATPPEKRTEAQQRAIALAR